MGRQDPAVSANQSTGAGLHAAPGDFPAPQRPRVCGGLAGNPTSRISLPPVVAVVLLVLAVAAVLMAVPIAFHHLLERRCQRLHCCLTLVRHLEVRAPASAPRYMVASYWPRGTGAEFWDL